MIAPLFLALTSLLSADPGGGHPWLDKQLKKPRVKCQPGDSPSRGAADAPVTIVEFGDFECPYCVQEEPTIQKVLAAYPTQVRVVWKNLPLDIHPKAKHKALVAECVGAQGKFWQAHDKWLSGGKPDEVKAGTDEAKVAACVKAGGEGQVDKDLALAKSLGMATTPGFCINGIRQGGVIEFPKLKLLIDEEVARKGGGAGAAPAPAPAK